VGTPRRGRWIWSRLELGAEHHSWRTVSDSKRRLRRSALEVVVYAVFAYLLLRLVPSLKLAPHSLARLSWKRVVGAIGLQVVSELGFVFACRFGRQHPHMPAPSMVDSTTRRPAPDLASLSAGGIMALPCCSPETRDERAAAGQSVRCIRAVSPAPS
jgi:hypothetical protein